MGLMTIVRWNNGWMMEEFLWSDAPAMHRQLGVRPSRPADFLPDFELNTATPLSISPGVDESAENKAKMSAADDALNVGNLTLDSLSLSPNVSVYGLADLPLDTEGYIAWRRSMKVAFPDLRLDNKPYRQIIGQGDWTSTIAFLSGTQSGPLTLPVYLSDSPIAPTGKKVDLLHFNIARWQDGKIVGMRVNLDTFGIIASLGISLYSRVIFSLGTRSESPTEM